MAGVESFRRDGAVSRSPVLCTWSAAVILSNILGGQPRWRAGGFQTEQ